LNPVKSRKSTRRRSSRQQHVHPATPATLPAWRWDGLRGFVFADLFHTPLILVGTLILFGGAVTLFVTQAGNLASPVDFFRPILPTSQCVTFAFHVLFLNSFLVLVSEAHWLRMWIFGDNETTQQKPSLRWLAILWGLLILTGFLTSDITHQKVGEDAIAGLLSNLMAVSWIFPIAFWAAGTAALFSSADAAIYSFLIVRRFDGSTGKLVQMRTAEIRPAFYTFVVSGIYVITYALVRHFQIPFEKIVFVVMPLNLNILPAFIFAVRRTPQKPILIWISLALYASASTIGFLQSSNQLFWTLMAALMPVLASVVAFVWTFALPQREEQK